MGYTRIIIVGSIAAIVGAIPMVASQAPTGLPGEGDALWKVHLAGVEESLGRGDLGAAERASRLAYGEAVWSRRWEAMIAAGDTALRLGQAEGRRQAFEPAARRAYRAALLRARGQGSLDGVLRAAEAFAALGDREVAQGCLRIAEGLAAQTADPEAHARVEAFRERLASRWPDPGTPGPGFF
jgi:hypothetical protein